MVILSVYFKFDWGFGPWGLARVAEDLLPIGLGRKAPGEVSERRGRLHMGWKLVFPGPRGYRPPLSLCAPLGEKPGGGRGETQLGGTHICGLGTHPLERLGPDGF